MVPSETFVEQVSQAYDHLYDIVYLRTHALVNSLLATGITETKERGWALHQVLLDAIDELDPGPGAPAFSHAWRRHRLMVLHYVEGLTPRAVAERLAVSRRTYYREHKEAIGAIAALLWDRKRDLQNTADESDEGQSSLDRIELLRMNAARIIRSERTAPLGEVVAEVVLLARKLAKERNMEIRVVAPETVNDQVSVDRNTIRQLVLEGMSFALEGSKDGTLTIQLRGESGSVHLRLSSEPMHTIPDHPESLRDQQRTHLSVLKELAQARQVGVELEGNWQQGLCIDLCLPTLDPKTILVAEDNEDTLELFARYLALHGYKPLRARSGADAIRLAKNHQPYAILLDLMMPDQDGWDVLQTLSNQPETTHIPTIVCTVLSARQLALSLGAAAFLEKPVSEQDLLQALAALGDSSQPFPSTAD